MDIQANSNSVLTATQPNQRQRMTKLKPTDNSFWLGQDSAASPQAPSGKRREFRFHVPSAAELGNVEESTKMLQIAHSLSSSGIGHVARLTISNSAWEIHFRLQPVTDVAHEEQYLTEISRQLAPTVEQLPDLKTGFQRGKGSTWNYCINDFVAAEGHL